MGKTEDFFYASDEELLSISKRFIRQNKEAYEELAKRVNPHEDMSNTAKSLFGILPKNADIEESRTEMLRKWTY